ncbi:MAG: DUF4105 domain-containing protein [Cytophagales bacterium]|nr:MAG: DUF4105 domain-containing protein [Cytophagales bacterium]
MKKTFYLFLTLYFIVLTLPAKMLSSNTKIYLVTVGPGDELYSGFGHSALWFQDSTLQIDRVYNYGTFHFDAQFYIKFTLIFMVFWLSTLIGTSDLANWILENTLVFIFLVFLW